MFKLFHQDIRAIIQNYICYNTEKYMTMLYDMPLIASIYIVDKTHSQLQIIYKSLFVDIFKCTDLYQIYFLKNQRILYDHRVVFSYESNDTLIFEFSYFNKNGYIDITYTKIGGHIDKCNRIVLNGIIIDDNDNIYFTIFCILRNKAKTIFA